MLQTGEVPRRAGSDGAAGGELPPRKARTMAALSITSTALTVWRTLRRRRWAADSRRRRWAPRAKENPAAARPAPSCPLRRAATVGRPVGKERDLSDGKTRGSKLRTSGSSLCRPPWLMGTKRAKSTAQAVRRETIWANTAGDLPRKPAEPPQ